MTRRLLLISSSRIHYGGYMEYCHQELLDFWGPIRNLLFIPFAHHDYDAYIAMVRPPLQLMGFNVTSIHETPDYQQAIQQAEGIFTGGGNTFLLLDTLYRHNLLAPIRKRVFSGMPYMGSSAGSNVACTTMKTTNDMPIIYPPSFEALNLVPFNINPHYFDPDPNSTHMGETREQRIREFHQHNTAPVVGLWEGGLLHVEGEQMWLKGVAGVKLFQRDQAPVTYEPISDLSFLLKFEV